jgi:glycosyltransferase involved in cell wall biosynthesis
MKKKILFVNQSQYGYHIDYVQYCKYLKKDFEITFICWDYNRKKIEESGIIVLYISRKGNIITRNFRFIRSILECLKQKKYDLTFINYFRGSSLISLLNKIQQPLHLDIRTGSVSKNTIKRNIYNSILRFESHFFKRISIISTGLRQMLGINKNAYILPLGANPICVKRNINHKLHLLYVGTLSGRRIEDTIKGMSLFLLAQPKADIFYTIVGDGWQNEKQNLQNKIIQLGLQEHFYLSGYVPYNELISFYETSNIGVSYIPITPYYEYQPATKTFEYLMAGMPVIATETYENMLVVNGSNGVLIKDNPESFANGIAIINDNIKKYNENIIRKSVENYEWSPIIQSMKEKILK